MDPYRHERVAETIREELEELVGYELSDPRIGTVNISEVVLSPDYRHANVRLTLQGSPQEQEQTLEGIEHAKQFLKHQLADRLQLFRTPDLHFESALSPNLAARAPQILKRMKRGRPKPEKNAIS